MDIPNGLYYGELKLWEECVPARDALRRLSQFREAYAVGALLPCPMEYMITHINMDLPQTEGLNELAADGWRIKHVISPPSGMMNAAFVLERELARS